MDYLYTVLGWIMDWCYGLCHNYGIAIIIFTFVSKIILLPVSIWTHLNSIKMIKIQPDINFMKAKYYGQSDIISEKQSELFKKEGYSPMASTIPLFIQLFLLMGVVGVIKIGITSGDIDMSFGSINLGLVPSEVGVSLLYAPILAGISSWLLSITQNASNVLQSEQSKLNKYGTMVFSVCLSLYLGWFVPLGTAWYWVCSNLMAIIQMYILNAVIKPSKYVDYERLEESRKQLNELQSVGNSKKQKIPREYKIKEKKDYKRFFSVVNKHLVFYSEGRGFYKYYAGIIEYLLKNTNITIHYITSDPEDPVFEMEKENEHFRAYYIGENKLITLMMKIEADVVVMTMPDLENYHIKRSYIKKDIEYIYVPHGLDSINLTMRKGSVDHFDTVLCTSRNQVEEIRATENVYRLPAKELIECGYPVLDDMRSAYKKSDAHGNKQILIAPSWQADNIVDNCLEQILDALSGSGYNITVRPHPQHVRHKAEQMEKLKERYKNCEDITIQTDFSSNSTVFNADLVITDWSGIAFEFAFTTCKPVLFINTPMKVMNPEYEKIDVIPMNIGVRSELGAELNLDELDKVKPVVDELIASQDKYVEKINNYIHDYVYNLDKSAVVAGRYIAQTIINKINGGKK